MAVDWAYVPRLYSPAIISDIGTEYGKYSSSIIKNIRETKLMYDVQLIEYTQEWLANTSAQYLVTSNSVFNRFFCTGTFTKIVPPLGTELGNGFEQRKNFYNQLFSGGGWKQIQSFMTKNGPQTYIFRKAEDESPQDKTRKRELSLIAGC